MQAPTENPAVEYDRSFRPMPKEELSATVEEVTLPSRGWVVGKNFCAPSVRSEAENLRSDVAHSMQKGTPEHFKLPDAYAHELELNRAGGLL